MNNQKPTNSHGPLPKVTLNKGSISQTEVWGRKNIVFMEGQWKKKAKPNSEICVRECTLVILVARLGEANVPLKCQIGQMWVKQPMSSCYNYYCCHYLSETCRNRLQNVERDAGLQGCAARVKRTQGTVGARMHGWVIILFLEACCILMG